MSRMGGRGSLAPFVGARFTGRLQFMSLLRKRPNTPAKNIFRLVIFGYGADVIRARAGKILLSLDVFEDCADAELLAFASEPEGFRSGLEGLSCGAKLIEK